MPEKPENALFLKNLQKTLKKERTSKSKTSNPPYTMVVTHKSVTKKSEKVTRKSYEKEEIIMASRSSNRAAVPEAKSALDKFKYEVASELGVPLSDGYNGDLTSKQNGSVGGYMVKKMIEQQERQMAGK